MQRVIGQTNRQICTLQNGGTQTRDDFQQFQVCTNDHETLHESICWKKIHSSKKKPDKNSGLFTLNTPTIGCLLPIKKRNEQQEGKKQTDKWATRAPRFFTQHHSRDQKENTMKKSTHTTGKVRTDLFRIGGRKPRRTLSARLVSINTLYALCIEDQPRQKTPYHNPIRQPRMCGLEKAR